MAVFPVTIATGERSFSALKYIKNYLRSTMGEDRLNGLAQLYINRDIPLDYGKVIDEFGRTIVVSVSANIFSTSVSFYVSGLFVHA
jgi:hypothetical protein